MRSGAGAGAVAGMDAWAGIWVTIVTGPGTGSAVWAKFGAAGPWRGGPVGDVRGEGGGRGEFVPGGRREGRKGRPTHYAKRPDTL